MRAVPGNNRPTLSWCIKLPAALFLQAMTASLIGRTLSHYRVLEKLGEGGMGVVYLAEDTLLGRRVAINERGHVKVLDFGLAKQIGLEAADLTDPERQTLMVAHTREGLIVGTPMYLSPEQALGNEVDARSDLFSLGSLLYECLAGKPAFVGKSAADICAKVMRDDPPPPSTLNPAVPKELDRIALKSLAKKPEARYQTADEMIAELESVQGNLFSDASNTVTRVIPSAVETRPSGALATLSDIFRRPRLPIGYVVAALVAVTVLALGIWYLVRARPHQPNSDAQRLYETGSNALRSGSFFQASKALSLAISSDDQFALAHARLAEAWMELDYSDQAKDELLRVGELSPNRSLFTPVDALYLDAITATVRRDFPRSITAYAEIARLQPDQSYVYVDLGRAYEKNNQLDKAIESYTIATSKDSQNGTAVLRLGVLQGRKHNLAEAGIAFDKADTSYQARRNVEGRADVALRRGVLLNDIAGRVAEARAQLEQAREIARVVTNTYQQIKILFQLSSVAIKEGQTDQAQQYAREAVQLAQANQMESLIARGNIEIGNVYLVRGNYNDAENYFQQALEAAQHYGGRQNEARARLSLASLYIQRGETDRGLGLEGQALAFYQPGGS